jgi:hypothetical protein
MRARRGSPARKATGRPITPPVTSPATAAFFQSQLFREASIEQCVNWYLSKEVSVTERGSIENRQSVHMTGRAAAECSKILQAKECGEPAAVEDGVSSDVAYEHPAAQIVVPAVVA